LRLQLRADRRIANQPVARRLALAGSSRRGENAEHDHTEVQQTPSMIER